MKVHAILALTLALLLTACGGGGTPATPAPAGEATVAPMAATAAPAAPTPTTGTDAAPTPESAAATPAALTPESAAGPITYAIIPQESRVSYEVGEVFINRNNQYNLAIGVTQEITGEISLDLAAPRNSSVGPISINISAFQSDSSRRDDAIRRQWLESARFPIATFAPTQIDGLPETYTEGEEITLTIAGDLTVREVTRPATFEVRGRIAGEMMTGTATTSFKMSDFGIEPPNILNVLRSEDDVTVKFTFVARPTM